MTQYVNLNRRYSIATQVVLALVFLMLMSVLVSAPFGLALTLMLIVHEGGHYVAMRRMNIPCKGIYFIPLVGAALIPKEIDTPLTRDQEFIIAVGGPIGGLIFSMIASLGWVILSQPIYLAIASIMALVNLINMAPFVPLDGGRILRSTLYSLNKKAGHAFLAISAIVQATIAVRFESFLLAVLSTGCAFQLENELVDCSNSPCMKKKDSVAALFIYMVVCAMLTAFTLIPMTLGMYQSGYNALFG